ncbi:quinoprotein relay system zinc metallohydrolase 1 [Pseudomonas sp. GD04087]|uniref:quinoprotein relay system zinc metallohydrolase 1 n=1 Tax=unclassified Pseudomonas TaxID=196821 RepID=UPI00244D1419|nr:MULTISPECIES: quinoprotein relay system zinc metallohydrolase 1 [unclassified Pseudomonas]MDH0293081.1 quinoprotein relay system zinc metallohydrolase 1 [Pseudomonas sp. GD04087]MDH1052305.1 quinoprotein relay system zinc metallohydrolase 1 [Pseudomonas sp. GD03903]MDH2003523.1 quinoprotein relay system zinc metallohydrolase 1 [Pseudomonas sp. GD03691]
MRFLLIALACLCLPAWADLQYHLQPRQIAEGTWVVQGSTDNFAKDNGGAIVNVAFIDSGDGVLVIDSGPSKRYGEALRALIQQTTGKPVKRVLLTHHHPDHVLGNQAFTDVPIGALAGTSKLLKEQGNAMAENMYRLVGDWMRGTEVVLPSETVEPGELQMGSHRFRLLGLRGHTGADLAILDETTGVLFAGDIVFYQRALTTPNSPGLDVWLGDLDTLQQLPWKQIVPGHGPIASDAAPFTQMRDYLGWLDSVMRDGIAQGADMNDLLRTPIPERFAGVSLTRYELIRSVSHLYPRYEQKALPRVDEQ